MSERPRTDAILVNAKKAAAMLDIGTRTLWARTNTGEIPCIRVGRSVRYKVDDLRAWADACASRKESR